MRLSACRDSFHFVLHFFFLAEHELLFVFPEELRASLNIDEESVNFTDVSDVYLSSFALLGDQVASRNQMNCITKRALLANLGEQLHSVVGDLNVLLLAADFKNLAYLTVTVRPCRDNQRTIEQINGQAVR